MSSSPIEIWCRTAHDEVLTANIVETSMRQLTQVVKGPVLGSRNTGASAREFEPHSCQYFYVFARSSRSNPFVPGLN